MAQIVITVNSTISDDGTKIAVLDSVKDALGKDITGDFKKYCSDNKFQLSTQEYIDQAAIDYSINKKDTLP